MLELLHEPHFWSALAFVLFFVFFGKKVWKPLVAALDNRAVKIREELDEATRLRREAEEIYTAAQKEREAAAAEAEKMLKLSQQEAQRIAEQAQKDSDDMIHRHEEIAKVRLISSEHEAIASVRREAADIAVKAAQEVIASVLTGEKDKVLINRAIDELPKAFTKNRNAA